VRADGRYALPPYLGSFPSDPRCAPFLVRAGDHLAGFALVRAYSQLTGDPAVHDLLDFFILRKYRGRGVGATVACALFDRFPGRWEVRQYVTNLAAQRFWRRVIERYTGGRYTELAWDDDRHRGVVQRFDTTILPPRAGHFAGSGDGEEAQGGRR
jgi:predicted acetyltransferase